MKARSLVVEMLLLITIVGCATGSPDIQGEIDIKEHKEFESVVKIEETGDSGEKSANVEAPETKSEGLDEQGGAKKTDHFHARKKVKVGKVKEGSKAKAQLEVKKKPNSKASTKGPIQRTKPIKGATTEKAKISDAGKNVESLLVKPTATIEDRTGFLGRRPIVDPFVPGEQVALDISYFGVSAGTLILRTKSYAKVNGRKTYHFQAKLNSNSVFSRIYSVDDIAETYVDFAELVPLTFEVHLKQTKVLQESRAYFNWKDLLATKWEKKLTPDEGATEKKISWTIDPYSQNVFSAPFYMRAFPLYPGKKLAFRVADDGKNVTFDGVVLRREVLETDVGKFKTVVLKPRIIADGMFQQDGDILFWLTDDDQKLIVGFEGKIKVGTIKASLKSINRGQKVKN